MCGLFHVSSFSYVYCYCFSFFSCTDGMYPHHLSSYWLVAWRNFRLGPRPVWAVQQANNNSPLPLGSLLMRTDTLAVPSSVSPSVLAQKYTYVPFMPRHNPPPASRVPFVVAAPAIPLIHLMPPCESHTPLFLSPLPNKHIPPTYPPRIFLWFCATFNFFCFVLICTFWFEGFISRSRWKVEQNPCDFSASRHRLKG